MKVNSIISRVIGIKRAPFPRCQAKRFWQKSEFSKLKLIISSEYLPDMSSRTIVKDLYEPNIACKRCLAGATNDKVGYNSMKEL